MSIWKALWLAPEFPLYLFFLIIVLLFLLMGGILVYNSFKNRKDIGTILNCMFDKGEATMKDELGNVLNAALNDTTTPGGSRRESRRKGIQERARTFNISVHQVADTLAELGEKRAFDDAIDQVDTLGNQIIDAVANQDAKFAEMAPLYTQPTLAAQQTEGTTGTDVITGQPPTPEAPTEVAAPEAPAEVATPEAPADEAPTPEAPAEVPAPEVHVAEVPAGEDIASLARKEVKKCDLFFPAFEHHGIDINSEYDFKTLPNVLFDKIWGKFNLLPERKFFEFIDAIKTERGCID